MNVDLIRRMAVTTWSSFVKQAFVIRNRSARPHSRFPGNRVLLSLEQLEARDVPDALTFLPDSGNWGVNTNWSGGQVPTANDTATIPAAKVCTVDVPAIAKEVGVAATATLTIPNLGGFGLLADNGVANSGTLNVSGVVFGSVANSGTSTITNTGRVTGMVDNSRSLRIFGGTITGALLNQFGGTTLVAIGGTVGTLSNAGAIWFTGALPSLSVTGDFDQGNSGTLEMNASGVNINAVEVGGTASLAGSLTVTLIGAAPNRQQQYFPVTWGARNGVFGAAGPYALGDYTFGTTYLANSLRLAVPDPQLAFLWEHLPSVVGVASGGPFAEFFDDAPGLTASDYSVTLDWGDGPETGSVTEYPGEPGHYLIDGPPHSYDSPGWYTLTIRLTDTVSNVTWEFQIEFYVSEY